MSNQGSLFLSCLKATALIEKKSLLGLTFAEKCKLGIHTSMCKVCKAYIKESKIIDEGLFALKPPDKEEDNTVLKDKIIKSLKNK